MDSNVVKKGGNDGDGTSGDLISRTQAIDEIHEDAEWLASQGSDWQTERMERDKSILMSLPSVQPELKELSEWKADFKGYINALNMPKDDYDGIMEYIDEVPSAQPDIIRCRNCKFASGDSRICMQFGHSSIGELDFCAWAERRTDG